MDHPRRRNKGFTMVELMVSTAVLVLLLAGVYMSLDSISRTIGIEDSILLADQHANNALDEITQLLQPAVFPFTPVPGVGVSYPPGVGNPPESPTPADVLKGYKKSLFTLVDDGVIGFNTANGVNWRNALIRGMDSLAFVVPVDAEWDGDFIDDAGHFELGQIAPSRQSLGSNFGSSGSLNFVISDTTPINAVAAIDPNLLNSPIVENVNNFDFATSPGIQAAGMAWPTITAFTVIRYIPVMQGGAPVVISEATLGYDLDGDGLTNGLFNIGRLEVVYPGGSHNEQSQIAGTPPVQQNGLPQLRKPLTASYVLRRTDRSTPLFRLQYYDSSNIANTGFVDQNSGNGEFALQVRLLMFDSESIANQLKTPGTPGGGRVYYPRWHESTITLRNMTRN